MLKDVKNLFQHSAVYGLGDMLSRAVGTLLLPFFTRVLTKEDYSSMTLAYTTSAFISLLYTGGIDLSFLRYYLEPGRIKDETVDEKNIFSTAYATVFFWGLLISIIIFACSSQLALFVIFRPDAAFIFRFLAPILFLDAMNLFPLLVLRAHKHSAYYSIIVFLKFFLTVLMNIIFVKYLGRGFRGVFESNLLISAVIFLVLLPITLKQFKHTWTLQTVNALFKIGFPAVLGVLTLRIVDLSDRFLLRYFMGDDAVAVYQATYKLGMAILLIVGAFRLAWQPFYVDVYKNKDHQAIFGRVLTYYVWIGLWGVLGILVLRREMMLVMVDPSYRHMGIIIPIIALGYFFYGVYLYMLAGLFLKERTRSIPLITFFAALINFGLNLIFIPRWGELGAAITTIFAYFFMAVMLSIVSWRLFKVNYEYLRLVKIVFIFFLIPFIMAILYVPESFIFRQFYSLFLIILYPCLTICFGWLGDDEKAALRTHILRRVKHFV